MNEPFVKIDLHGMTQDEAIKVIDKAIASAGPATYHLQLIHGYNRGTSLRSMTSISIRGGKGQIEMEGRSGGERQPGLRTSGHRVQMCRPDRKTSA